MGHSRTNCCSRSRAESVLDDQCSKNRGRGLSCAETRYKWRCSHEKGGKVKSGGKICPEGKVWAKRTFDTYLSAYANLAASKYCKDPNYAKKSKGGKRKG